MFFIGGINSVLPFVLYVSLIWICMAIGFGNKLKALMHSQVIPAQSVQNEAPAKTVQAFLLAPENEALSPRVHKKGARFAVMPEATRPIASSVTRMERTCGTRLQVASLAIPNAYRGPPSGLTLTSEVCWKCLMRPDVY
jgi:hypothetical protein